MENKTKESNSDMGKCSKCEATQFLSYGVCNYNGICDGKVEPIKKSTRELAFEWFDSKSSLEKTRLCDINTEIIGKPRRYESLTDREIEEIWRKENFDNDGNPQRGITIAKPNQKQFKEFNPELFKAYIDKFSDEDLKAYHIIGVKISIRNSQK